MEDKPYANGGIVKNCAWNGNYITTGYIQQQKLEFNREDYDINDNSADVIEYFMKLLNKGSEHNGST